MEHSSTHNKKSTSKVWQLISTASQSRTISLLVLLLILAAVPLTVFVAGQIQDLRQSAQQLASCPGVELRVNAPSLQLPQAGSLTVEFEVAGDTDTQNREDTVRYRETQNGTYAPITENEIYDCNFYQSSINRGTCKVKKAGFYKWVHAKTCPTGSSTSCTSCATITEFAVLPAPAATHTIQGTIWADTENEGTRDTNELGEPNIPVHLNGTLADGTTFSLPVKRTDTSGQYIFSGLPEGGNYTVKIDVPTDRIERITRNHDNNTNDQVTIRNLQDDADLSWGLKPKSGTASVTVSGTVKFVDQSNTDITSNWKNLLKDKTINMTGAPALIRIDIDENTGTFSKAGVIYGQEYSLEPPAIEGFTVTPASETCQVAGKQVQGTGNCADRDKAVDNNFLFTYKMIANCPTGALNPTIDSNMPRSADGKTTYVTLRWNDVLQGTPDNQKDYRIRLSDSTPGHSIKIDGDNIQSNCDENANNQLDICKDGWMSNSMTLAANTPQSERVSYGWWMHAVKPGCPVINDNPAQGFYVNPINAGGPQTKHKISGKVFEDPNNTGNPEGKTGKDEVEITIVYTDGTNESLIPDYDYSQITQNGGNFTFENLPDGRKYKLTMSLANFAGYQRTAASKPNPYITSSNLTADITDVNWGIKRSAGGGPITEDCPTGSKTPKNSISGIVYDDRKTNDGHYDPSADTRLSGWKIILKDSNNSTKETMSTGTGYKFDKLCDGTYKITEELKEGWNITEPGNSRKEHTKTVENRTALTDVDFGNVPESEEDSDPNKTYSMDINVFIDSNNDGARQSDEKGFASAVIALELTQNPSGKVVSQTLITDSQGKISIRPNNLALYEGKYRITLNTNTTNGLTLRTGTPNPSTRFLNSQTPSAIVNFPLINPNAPAPTKHTISGEVWADIDLRDGEDFKEDIDELVPRARLQLYQKLDKGLGPTTYTAITGRSQRDLGLFEFTDIPAGTYYIYVNEIPQNFRVRGYNTYELPEIILGSEEESEATVEIRLYSKDGNNPPRGIGSGKFRSVGESCSAPNEEDKKSSRCNNLPSSVPDTEIIDIDGNGAIEPILDYNALYSLTISNLTCFSSGDCSDGLSKASDAPNGCNVSSGKRKKNFRLCGDISGKTAGVPDGKIDSDDFGYYKYKLSQWLEKN